MECWGCVGHIYTGLSIEEATGVAFGGDTLKRGVQCA